MTEFQLYVYLVGFVFFFIGVYFHIQKKKKDISEKKKLVRHRLMYFFLILAVICVVYSWI
jgi:cytochrome bd-type quinol oxidase subunit 1